MTVVEYLSQAYRLDLRINSKIEQVASLNDLALKATSGNGYAAQSEQWQVHDGRHHR